MGSDAIRETIKMERLFTIEEVAKRLGVSKQTLLRYEKKGIFPPARRNRVNRWREYTNKDVQRLKKILGRR